MQKNTILGFVLIGLILIGFSWYNSYNYKKQAREAFVKDSLARIEALTNPRVADSLRIADSIRNAAIGIKDTSSSSALQVSDSSSVAVTEEVVEFSGETFAEVQVPLFFVTEISVFLHFNTMLFIFDRSDQVSVELSLQVPEY